VALAGLGAVAVGSAVFLILELSDPYTGLFRIWDETFDELIVVLTKNRQVASGSR
jgi:hypothetical protein